MTTVFYFRNNRALCHSPTCSV